MLVNEPWWMHLLLGSLITLVMFLFFYASGYYFTKGKLKAEEEWRKKK